MGVGERLVCWYGCSLNVWWISAASFSYFVCAMDELLEPGSFAWLR